MKQIFTFIFMLSLMPALQGQSLQLSHLDVDVSNDTVYLVNGQGETYMESRIAIHNGTDKSVDVQVKRTELSLAENSTNSFCWGAYCYPPFISESDQPVRIAAADQNRDAFIGEYTAAQDDEGQPLAGTSVIRYTFFLDGTPADSVSVVVFYQAGAAGVHDWTIRPNLFRAWPNPTTGWLQLDFPGKVNQQVHLRVMSMTGLTVLEQELGVGESHTRIDLGALPRGYYFVQIRNNEGKQQLKKILKSN